MTGVMEMSKTEDMSGLRKAAVLLVQLGKDESAKNSGHPVQQSGRSALELSGLKIGDEQPHFAGKREQGRFESRRWLRRGSDDVRGL